MFKYFILRAQQQRSVISAASCLRWFLCSCSLLFSGGVGFICFYRLLCCSGQVLPFIPVTSTG